MELEKYQRNDILASLNFKIIDLYLWVELWLAAIP